MSAETPKDPYSFEEPEPEPAPSGDEAGDAVDQVRVVAGRCPECGAELDPSEDVCIRCGFRRKPERGSPSPKPKRESEIDAPAPEAGEPISPLSWSPGFDFWLPVTLVAAALLLLLVGHLAGAIGLFPQARLAELEAVPWPTRFNELLRTIVLILFWTGCGLAGLFMLALMFERPLGEARVAALRMAAIVSTIRLAAFISVSAPRWVEWMVEALVQAAGFVLLAVLLYRMPIRNAGILALWTLLAIFVLWLFTYAVQWVLAG